MSVEDINRFTKDDIVCALEMFNEDYVTFPRNDIAKLSGLSMPVNKRNGRTQEEHLRRARAVQLIDYPDFEWAGRPSAQEKVREWRQYHPDGKPKECMQQIGLSKNTVYKWWRESESV